MEVSHKIICLGIISATVLFTPFIWYSVIKVFKHRKDIFIEKKDAELLLIILCLLAIDITILEPIWTVLIELKTIHSLETLHPHNVETILGVIYCDYQFITFEFIYFRLYLMYYDHKHAMQVRDIKWENIFNENTSSWFTKHRHTFGSKIWLKKPFIFIFFMFIISNIIKFIFPKYPFRGMFFIYIKIQINV